MRSVVCNRSGDLRPLSLQIRYIQKGVRCVHLRHRRIDVCGILHGLFLAKGNIASDEFRLSCRIGVLLAGCGGVRSAQTLRALLVPCFRACRADTVSSRNVHANYRVNNTPYSKIKSGAEYYFKIVLIYLLTVLQ